MSQFRSSLLRPNAAGSALLAAILLAALFVPTRSAAAAPTIIDSGTNAGRFTSIALNAAGNPVIAYRSSGQLTVASCGDPSCATAFVNPVLGGENGTWTSLAINDAGNPVIAHFDLGGEDLRLTVCDDATCASAFTRIIESDGAVGEYPSIEINSLGNPVISYWDRTEGSLRLAVCEDATCAVSTQVTVDGNGNSGWFSSLALDASDNPIITYRDAGSGSLQLAVCEDSRCATAVRQRLDGQIAGQIVNTGLYTSIALDSLGNPVVAYHDFTNGDLRLATCSDRTCTSPERIAIDTVGNVGLFASLQLTADDRPVIAYHDDTARNLKLAVCNDASCATPSIVTLDDTGTSGGYVAMVIGAEERPTVSYWDETNNNLNLAVCDDAACGPSDPGGGGGEPSDFTIDVDLVSPRPNQIVTFEVSVICTSAGVLNVDVELPSGLAPTGAFATTNGTATLAGQTFAWTPNPDPALGDAFCPAIALIEARVTATAVGALEATVTIGDETQSVTLNVEDLDFVVEKATNLATVLRGDATEWTLTVPCELLLGEIAVTDVFPEGVIPTEAMTNNGGVVLAGQTLGWTPTIDPALPAENCPAVATVTAVVASDQPFGTVTNTMVAATTDGATQAEDSAEMLTVQLGDVDCDGRISLLDGRRVAQVAIGANVGEDPCPTPNANRLGFLPAGDMDGDGRMTLFDAVFVMRCAIGTPTTGCPDPA